MITIELPPSRIVSAGGSNSFLLAYLFVKFRHEKNFVKVWHAEFLIVKFKVISLRTCNSIKLSLGQGTVHINEMLQFYGEKKIHLIHLELSSLPMDIR